MKIKNQFGNFLGMSGAVRNADRIWARTPQNRTYRAWGNKYYQIKYLNFIKPRQQNRGKAMHSRDDPARFQTAPTGLETEINVDSVRPTCYDISDVERRYQFQLQCLQWDVRIVADSFRGCHALFQLAR